MFMAGMPVYFDSFLAETKQVSFPKTKNKRIRKKWAKRPENWRRVPLKVIYRVADSWVVHPGYWPEFCKAAGVTLEPTTRDVVEAVLPPAPPARKPRDHLFELGMTVPPFPQLFWHTAY